MRDPSFEVRYHCSTVLSTLAAAGNFGPLSQEEVFAYVRAELHVGRDEWKSRTITLDPVIESQEVETDLGLAHVFRVLGLVLPAEPLRVALHAVQADDTGLRGMALEYLESILPPDVRAQMWPLLDESSATEMRAVVPEPEGDHSAEAAARSSTLLDRMRETHPAFFEKMHVRRSG
jgi:hypothetical protein